MPKIHFAGKLFWFSIFIIIILLISCSGEDKVSDSSQEKEPPIPHAKFTILPPEQTGVNFINRFREDHNYNIFVFEYLYNGGGVAVGDVNGDSLPDIYFSATFGPNILYINQGDFTFINATVPAGVAAPNGFKTGVVMGDINNDGRLDIISCRTSKSDNGQKDNHVFINMGNQIINGTAIPVFEDQAVKLGLNDNSNTNHTCLIDYDRDGDLDVFLLNHPLTFKEATQLKLRPSSDGSMKRITSPSTPFESNRLYRNDNGHFTDVTLQAGLESSAFGLSVTAADINGDGWMDLFIGNDYIEPDMVMINNRDGTFTDKYAGYFKHSSQHSMGSDIADINNDGLPDIVVLDMKAEDPIRYKMLLNLMQYDRNALLEQHGYGRQVIRNMLQLNNGNNTFSEIGQYAGIGETDWSWGALIADFDNDGWKDMYIANGYRRDVSNLDYLNFIRDSIERSGGITPRRFPDINTVIELIPEKKLSNYLYLNNGKLQFINATSLAGLDQPSFSNGAAFADLDRDGDLDLIVNNIADPAFICRNDSELKSWIQIDLYDPKGNKDGIGAEADLYAKGMHQYQMLMVNKGFFSTSEPILHFGLGPDVASVDSIILTWPDGAREILTSVKANQRLMWKRGTAQPFPAYKKTAMEPLFISAGWIPGWIHREDKFVDFKRERLIPYMTSYEGPCMSTGDVNGDQLTDLFVGNGSGSHAALFLQTPQNTFTASSDEVFVNDAAYEDCGSLLEDFDGDGDLDLLVISGGSAFKPNDPGYQARYYTNDGQGNFQKAVHFPRLTTNAGYVHAFDYDSDGDKDIFIGGRNLPGSFPLPSKSFILQNDKGKFIDITKELFPAFSELGMITSMASGDLDGDGKEELIIAGEWMPISVFSWNGKSFIDKTATFGLSKLTGLWKTVVVDDIDGDGDLDMIVGGLGLNHRLKASENYPLTLVSDDFDDNGSQDPILGFYHQGNLYPYAGSDALIGQIPSMKKKYVRYAPYSTATVEDILGRHKFDQSRKLTVNTLQTILLINDGITFIQKELPYQVQLSPVYDIIVMDFNADGKKDLLMAGNFLYAEPETAEIDAGNGTLLLQNADGSFRFVHNLEHGFWSQGEVRELETIKLANGNTAILTGNNKGPVEMHILNINNTGVQ